MLSQREKAEKLRDKEELEKQREELKAKLEMHRDKGEGMTAEELEESKRDLEANGKLNEQIRALEEELKDAPEPNTEIGGKTRTMNVKEITRENFRGTTEYRDAFYRSLINRNIADSDKEIMGWSHERAITDMNGLSVTSGAAYLLPDTTVNEIKSIITEVSPLSTLVTKYNFNGNISIPIGTEDTTTNNADGTDTLNFIFTETAIGQDAVVAVIEMKNLLLKNGISGIEQYVARELAKYLGLQLENNIVNGNATNWQGIVTAIGVAAGTYDEMDWEEMASFLGAVEAPYGDVGVWVMRRATFFSKFYALTDAEGRPVVNTVPGMSGLPGVSPYVIGGRPVVFSSKIAANAVLYGDVKQFVMNVSQEMTIEADASAGFAADKMTWRGKIYAGGKCMFATTAFCYKTLSA